MRKDQLISSLQYVDVLATGGRGEMGVSESGSVVGADFEYLVSLQAHTKSNARWLRCWIQRTVQENLGYNEKALSQGPAGSNTQGIDNIMQNTKDRNSAIKILT